MTDSIASLGLQDIFTKILAGSTIELAFSSRKDFDSFRTMLLRKYKKYKDVLKDLDLPSEYQGKFISCTFNKDTNSGTFVLRAEDAKQKVSLKYIVKEL